jgi:hypothetical protein
MVKHIYIKEYVIHGEDYSIIFRSNSKNEYCRLCEGLINDMEISQIKKITIITPRNIKVLLFTDVINEFKKFKYSGMGSDDCICGKQEISKIYEIFNKETKNVLKIGSTCCKNWFDIKKENCCDFCGRKNNEEREKNCLNCLGKKKMRISTKKLLKKCRDLNEFINFGQYINKVTYLELRKNKYISYVNYVMSDKCHTSVDNKMKIQQSYRNDNNVEYNNKYVEA